MRWVGLILSRGMGQIIVIYHGMGRVNIVCQVIVISLTGSLELDKVINSIATK